MKYLLILPLLLLSLSCSDFFNGRVVRQTTPTNNPKKDKGNNPFEPGFDPNTGEFSEDKMLANIGLNVIYPQVREFWLHTQVLELELAKFIQTHATDAQEQIVKTQWSKAMLAFHSLDAAPFGPLSDNNSLLRQNIYAWPTLNSCGVDLEVAKLSLNGTPNRNLIYTLKGLGALEYLFFESELKTRCNPKNPNHKIAFEWEKKTATEKKLDRYHFAQIVVQDLIIQVQQLETAWNPQGENFSKTLGDGSRYPSLREAVNAVSDSLFQLEDLKDNRLGKPLGINKECLNPERKCPEFLEHQLSQITGQALLARLQGFKQVFLGAREDKDKIHFSFDDNLKSIGREDVSNRILEALNKAQQTAQEVEHLGSILEQIRNMNPDECKNSEGSNKSVRICALFYDVRQVAMRLKTDFLIALSLKAPPTHEGDND